jgi:ketosteroid isomerase-like protein
MSWLLVLSLAAVDPAAQPAAAVVDSFHAALKRGDGKAALALLDDNLVVFESGGAELSKAEYQAKHLDADMEFVKAIDESLTRRSGHVEGDLAWIETQGRTSGSFHGKKVDRATTETMILKREGGAWKIVHIHWSSGSH